MEFEDREPDQTLLGWLEANAGAALGPPSNWGVALDTELVANLGRYRRYDYSSLRDLLRVVRNKRNHFREMPESLQLLMGPLPEGYYRWAPCSRTSSLKAPCCALLLCGKHCAPQHCCMSASRPALTCPMSCA